MRRRNAVSPRPPSRTRCVPGCAGLSNSTSWRRSQDMLFSLRTRGALSKLSFFFEAVELTSVSTSHLLNGRPQREGAGIYASRDGLTVIFGDHEVGDAHVDADSVAAERENGDVVATADVVVQRVNGARVESGVQALRAVDEELVLDEHRV